MVPDAGAQAAKLETTVKSQQVIRDYPLVLDSTHRYTGDSARVAKSFWDDYQGRPMKMIG